MNTKFEHEYSKPYLRHNEGDHAVLVIHGFTGSPSHMRLLAEAFETAGLAVHSIALRGHATTLEEMRTFRWKDWVEDAQNAFDELKKRYAKVSVAGLSMGGCLTLIVAATRDVYRAIPICAPYKTMNRLVPLTPYVHWAMPYQGWDGSTDKRGVLENYDFGYEGMYTRNVADLYRVIKLADKGLPDIKCPLLIVEAAHDEQVRPASAQRQFTRAGSMEKKRLLLENSPHVCTIGPDREILFKECVEFLTKTTV